MSEYQKVRAEFVALMEEFCQAVELGTLTRGDIADGESIIDDAATKSEQRIKRATN